MSGYLTKEYGKLGFILCRDLQSGLTKGRDLEAFKEFYNCHQQVIIKLTVPTLINILSKLRNPEKIDVPNQTLDRILDSHILLYANGQGEKSVKRSATERRKKNK